MNLKVTEYEGKYRGPRVDNFGNILIIYAAFKGKLISKHLFSYSAESSAGTMSPMRILCRGRGRGGQKMCLQTYVYPFKIIHIVICIKGVIIRRGLELLISLIALIHSTRNYK
jgi:hypothetical protein